MQNSFFNLLVLVSLTSLGWSSAALNGGVTGNGTLQSAFPLKQKTLEFSMGGEMFQGEDLGLKGSSGDASRSTYFGALNYGILSYLEAGLLFPFHSDTDQDGQGFSGPGDLRTSVKFNYPPYPHKDGFKLSLLLQTDFPLSNNEEAEGGFNRHPWYLKSGSANLTRDPYGANSPVVTTKMLTTINLGAIEKMIPLLFHLNWGMAFSESKSQNAFLLGGGTEITVVPQVTAFWSFDAEVDVNAASKNIPLFDYPLMSALGLQFNIPKADLKILGGAKFVINEVDDINYTPAPGAPAAASDYSRVPAFGLFAGISTGVSFAPTPAK
jgi:hypothetical protein